jgi:hypothetical protein
LSVIPFGSIAVILLFSCGFEVIFAAIGFNGTDAPFGVVDVDARVEPDFVPCVGVEVELDDNVEPEVVP